MEASTPTPWCIDSPDPDATFALGALLGRAIGARGLAIGLIGPLGSGKTLFVKGLAEGLGLEPSQVSSPTFVIAQQYPLPEGLEALHHLDLYRLESEDELEAIGLRDWLSPGQVVAVEWLDRFPAALGTERLEVVFLPGVDPTSDEADAASGSGRRIRVTAYGDEPARVLRDLAERWARRNRGAAGEAPPGRAAPGGGARALAEPGVDPKRLLALLIAGGIGVATWGADPLLRRAPGVPGDRPSACRALAPLPLEAGAGPEPEADGLGPRRVVCLDDRPMAASAGRERSTGLDGIARLLDGGRLDPNDASPRLLERLPGIGPKRAAAIDAARRGRPFRDLRELERVPGIGPRIRARLEAWLAVDSEGPSG